MVAIAPVIARGDEGSLSGVQMAVAHFRAAVDAAGGGDDGLIELNLNKAGVTNADVAFLVAAVLTGECAAAEIQLDLEGNGLTDEGVAEVAQLLRASSVNVSVLKLGYNKISAAGAATLAAALLASKSLKILDLTFNSIGDAGAIALAEALEANPSIVELKLVKCQIGDDGVVAVAEALIEKNTKLQHLDIGSNRFGSYGFEVVAVAVSRGNLVSLTARNCDLRHEDAANIAQAMAATTAFKSLDLRANQIGELGARHLAEAMAVEGSAFESLDVKRNRVPREGLLAFVEAGVASKVACEGLDELLPPAPLSTMPLAPAAISEGAAPSA
jgi:hypothetical protein